MTDLSKYLVYTVFLYDMNLFDLSQAFEIMLFKNSQLDISFLEVVK